MCIRDRNISGAHTAPPPLLFDPSIVRGHTTPAALLADPAVGLVSICTYTDTHVDLALAALAAGKHVLVEKPLSLRSSEVRRLAEDARMAQAERGLLCMPAMCMRFWPGWDWLRERVRDGSLGKVRSANFQRLGSGPTWATAFYRDSLRSGGAIFDLHIHDTDFVCWCFGVPRAVVSTGDDQHISTMFQYASANAGAGTGPAHVVAEGAWDLAPGAGFRMRYTVNFEYATAEFDLSRTPALLLHTDAGTSAIESPLAGITTGYDGEVRHIVGAIVSDARTIRSTVDEAAMVTAVLEAEQASQRSGQPSLVTRA